MENFVYQLILHLKEIDVKNKYLLFTNKKLDQKLLSLNFQEIFIPFPKFWNKFRLSLAVLKYKPNVYLQPAHTIPMTAPQKTIAVLHDFGWIKFPDAYTKQQLLFQKMAIKNYAAKAKKVICISRSTERDLIHYYPEFQGKTKVIYIGPNQGNTDSQTTKKPEDVIRGLKNCRYLISLSRLEERKNTKRIIEAFYRYKSESAKDVDVKLILVGKPGSGYDQVKSALESGGKFKSDIIEAGYLSDLDVNVLMKNAVALLYPSLYEGFGITALEGMKMGVPVITSNTSSLPEVVGDAAILVDPLKIDEISQAIKKIVSSEALQKSMSKKGIEKGKEFSWEKTAKAYLNLMEQL